jgi:hypothetical protein
MPDMLCIDSSSSKRPPGMKKSLSIVAARVRCEYFTPARTSCPSQLSTFTAPSARIDDGLNAEINKITYYKGKPVFFCSDLEEVSLA